MIIGFLKIAFLLGFLIFIHELGHFLVAKFFNVKIKQFAIGFGPTVWKKQGKETSYELKLIPMGGFVNMLGEEEPVEDERAYNKKSIPKRICILLAGGLVNIIFGLLVCAIIASSILGLKNGIKFTGEFLGATFEGIGQLFTGKVEADQLVGVVRNIRHGSRNKWNERICLHDGSNISIIRSNKLTSISAIRWRKDITTNNTSNKKKTIKTKYRNRNTNGRLLLTNRIIYICNI